MNILVLNSGSSSLKCQLFDFSQFEGTYLSPLWETKIDGHSTTELQTQLRAQLSQTRIDCIGHRIVHGGHTYKESTRITPQVKQTIRSLADLAPLHNMLDMAGIETLENLFPNIPQIAVFDTAFHRTLPQSASTYPGPYEWAEQGIHRFGFHGISFQYCTSKVAEMLGSMPKKMVICHLGSGASLCAIQNGNSIDTTMGFTPLEGLMMGTRSGSIDPGILLYLLEKKKQSPHDLTRTLYEKSGLLGLSGMSSDMRDILQHRDNPRAKLALDVYIHRLVGAIGAMTASLEGLDVLVFTAGIGENVPYIRQEACKRLTFLGVTLEEPQGQGDRVLSPSRSQVQVLLIHTREEFEIARQCHELLTQNKAG